jgi:hypothetical protein
MEHVCSIHPPTQSTKSYTPASSSSAWGRAVPRAESHRITSHQPHTHTHTHIYIHTYYILYIYKHIKHTHQHLHLLLGRAVPVSNHSNDAAQLLLVFHQGRGALARVSAPLVPAVGRGCFCFLIWGGGVSGIICVCVCVCVCVCFGGCLCVWFFWGGGCWWGVYVIFHTH